jgi:hypothetical protein
LPNFTRPNIPFPAAPLVGDDGNFHKRNYTTAATQHQAANGIRWPSSHARDKGGEFATAACGAIKLLLSRWPWAERVEIMPSVGHQRFNATGSEDGCISVSVCAEGGMNNDLVFYQSSRSKVESVGLTNESVAFSCVTSSAEGLKIAFDPFAAPREWGDVVHVKIIFLEGHLTMDTPEIVFFQNFQTP